MIKLHVVIPYLVIIVLVLYFLTELKHDGKTAREWADVYYRSQADLFLANSEIEDLKSNNDSELKLNKCISDAETAYNLFFKLNSEPSDSGVEGVRTWNSKVFQDDAEEKLLNDKEFCLKRYQK